MKNRLNVEYIPVGQLKPYEKNARKHAEYDVGQIAHSIEEYGFNDPIGIWGKDNIIVEGHGRLLAAKKLGMKEVPCIRLDDLTDKQRREYAILHNKTAELSSWDFDLLAEDIGELDFSGFDIDWGFPENEEEKEIIEDEPPEVDEEHEPICKLGDIWQLGRHKLICGDSTDKATVERLMDGKKADMVFTDPPYGNGTSGKYGRGRLGVRTIKGDENLDVFTKAIELLEFERIVYFLQWRTLAESLEAISEKGLKINTVAVWDKKNAGLNGAGGISEQWEAIIFAGNIKYKKFGGNVFTIAREQHRREDSPHPHQKPIKLLAEIFDFIDECKSVFDPFGGSGSTLIACEQLDRVCYMCEISTHYCDAIIKRWENFTGQKAVKIS